MRRTVMGLCALAMAASVLSPSARAEIVGDEVDATQETRGVVYIIPIRGMIEPALLYVIRRGLDEAKSADARAIVFVMDTPGGTLNAASEIVRTIQKLSVPTYTFVEKDAFSAGAIIALSTEHIYMAPGSVIGDAMPIMMTPFGGAQEMPDDLKEKAVSAVAALVRSAAQKSGHREELAEKMVRREIELKIGDVVICPTGRLLTLTNVEAAKPVGADSRPLLSEGTVQDLDELLLRTGLEDAERKELAVTGAERVARFIASFAPLFLIAGLLGIYIEVKTPGFGLPGILGILSLAVFFWGHHIAGLAGMEDLVIFLVGALLLAVEILLIPGFGFVGISGILLMLIAIVGSMVRHYPGGPVLPAWNDMQGPIFVTAVSIIGTVVVAAVIAPFLPKTPLFNRLVLAKSTSRQAGFSASDDTDTLLGQEGLAVSPLRPSGSARFGKRRLDVITRGDFLEAGARVLVVETHGSRIIVEPVEARQGESAT